MKIIIIIGIVATVGYVAWDRAVFQPQREAARRQNDALWMRCVYGRETVG